MTLFDTSGILKSSGAVAASDILSNTKIAKSVVKIGTWAYWYSRVYAKKWSEKFLLPDAHGYRPRQWPSSTNKTEQMVLLKTNINGLFFDAVLSTNIETKLTVTSHPVQNGANISDHAYSEPVQVSMEIGMSDAMASMKPGQFYGAWSKSVSAYRQLVELQNSRKPFSILTRLNSYTDMVITGISVNDEPNALYGLKCSVNMQQIIMAEVTSEKVSARGWSTSAAAKKGEVSVEQSKKSELRKLEEALGKK